MKPDTRSMKYNVYEDGTFESFHEWRIHALVAGDRKVVSAGFLDRDANGNFSVSRGESTSLGIASRPEDVKLFQGQAVAKTQ